MASLGESSRPEKHQAKDILRHAFAKNPQPSDSQLIKLAKQCGRSVTVVSKWFEREREKERSNPAHKPTSLLSKDHKHPTPAKKESLQLARNTDEVGSNKKPALAPRQENNVSSIDKSSTINQSISLDEWDQFPFPDADNIPPMAFDGIPQHQHELHCAMALYHLATQGLPMSLAPQTK
ncbi:hypothetical protein BDV93DRAFT_602053 [Ceratobasidium sp. AG-I]|nr:hypothetical protein BDV93DRAFT_602053 [Ceratobasidium sp. AG-I]